MIKRIIDELTGGPRVPQEHVVEAAALGVPLEDIYRLGFTAAKCGIGTDAELEQAISLGMMASNRLMKIELFARDMRGDL